MAAARPLFAHVQLLKAWFCPGGPCQHNPQQPGSGLLAEECRSPGGETSRPVAPKGVGGSLSLHGAVVPRVLKASLSQSRPKTTQPLPGVPALHGVLSESQITCVLFMHPGN